MSEQVISPSLTAQPSRNYSFWRGSVSAYASAIGTADFIFGMVHLTISAAAWAELPGVRTMVQDAAGVQQVVIEPMPNPQRPAALPGNAPNAAVHVFREDTELHRRYKTYVGVLRAAILESLGPNIQLALRHPVHNIVVMSIPEIMDAVRVMYGTASAADIDDLLAQLAVPIQHGDHDSFVSFTVAFGQTVAALDRAGQPLSNYLQCRRLQEATSNQSTIARAVLLYFESTPQLANQDLQTMIPFVRLQLQNMSVSSVGYANVASSTSQQSSNVVSSLPSPLDNLTAAYLAGVEAGRSQHQRSHVAGGRGRGGRSNNRNGGRGAVGPTSSLSYCYHHGYGNHSGSNCNFMRRSSAHTAAMRAAASPNEVAGGHC